MPSFIRISMIILRYVTWPYQLNNMGMCNLVWLGRYVGIHQSSILPSPNSLIRNSSACPGTTYALCICIQAGQPDFLYTRNTNKFGDVQIMDIYIRIDSALFYCDDITPLHGVVRPRNRHHNCRSRLCNSQLFYEYPRTR